MRKYLFNNIWLRILGVYVVTFIVSFICAAAASEEYSKGQNRWIDAGTNMFNYVFFSPASLFEPIMINVHSGMILLVFLVNTVINAMFWVTGINFIYMKLTRRGLKTYNYMRVRDLCKRSYTISLSIIILLAACTHNQATNNRGQNRDQQNFQVYKIDSINNYYLIYAKRRDSLFKIVSKKELFNGGTKILINRKYPFTLESVWNAPLMTNNVNVSLSQTPHVTCLGYDDSTTICLEKDSINDLYQARNVRGLKFVRAVRQEQVN